MYRLRPLINRLASRGGSSPEFFLSSADDSLVIAEPMKRAGNQAVILGTELELITRMQNNVLYEDVFETLSAGEMTSGQTTCYIFRNALVHDGSIFNRRSHYHIRPRKGHLFPPPRTARKSSGFLCTNWVIEKYFGHWLREGLMLNLLGQQLGLEPIVFNRKPWIHEPEYRKLARCEVEPVESVIFDELVIADDRALNECWKNRIDLLRTRLIGAQPLPANKLVYMMRGKTGIGRTLVNEDAVVEYLSARGFEILLPEAVTVAEIRRVLTEAKLVICVEGSAQDHALMFMQTGTRILTIQPADQFNASFKPLCDFVGLTWGACVATGQNQKYIMDLDRLSVSIDLIMGKQCW